LIRFLDGLNVQRNCCNGANSKQKQQEHVCQAESGRDHLLCVVLYTDFDFGCSCLSNKVLWIPKPVQHPKVEQHAQHGDAENAVIQSLEPLTL